MFKIRTGEMTGVIKYGISGNMVPFDKTIKSAGIEIRPLYNLCRLIIKHY